jgi:hypothetical protein
MSTGGLAIALAETPHRFNGMVSFKQERVALDLFCLLTLVHVIRTVYNRLGYFLLQPHSFRRSECVYAA